MPRPTASEPVSTAPASRRFRVVELAMTVSTSSWLRQQSHSVRRLLAFGIAAGAAQAALVCIGAWLVAHVLTAAIFTGRCASMHCGLP